MTRRRSSYRSLRSLQRDNRVCRACLEAGFPIESLPVAQPYEGQRAYMLAADEFWQVFFALLFGAVALYLVDTEVAVRAV
jgi:hypothetical protein